MTTKTDQRPRAWSILGRRLDSPTTRASLAHLRRGVGKEAGTVPQMWPFYTTLTTSGQSTPSLRAEHETLTLFALHQQSRGTAMHVTGGLKLGEALRHYRFDSSGEWPDRASTPDAIDKRMAAIATATSFRELREHLRRAVNLLNRKEIPMDYDALFDDLVDWQMPGRRSLVVRRWGAQYFVPRPKSEAVINSQESPEGGHK